MMERYKNVDRLIDAHKELVDLDSELLTKIRSSKFYNPAHAIYLSRWSSKDGEVCPYVIRDDSPDGRILATVFPPLPDNLGLIVDVEEDGSITLTVDSAEQLSGIYVEDNTPLTYLHTNYGYERFYPVWLYMIDRIWIRSEQCYLETEWA